MPAVLAILLASSLTGTPGGENLYSGPARCVLGYLDAVRLAGPTGPHIGTAHPGPRDYRAARALTAPRALAEADRSATRGLEHPLAPWVAAGRGEVLESFSLLEVRRAPRGAAVVTVRERWRRAGPGRSLGLSASEYLVARVGGEWRVIDRREGGHFLDDDVLKGYRGWFDEPGSAASEVPP